MRYEYLNVKEVEFEWYKPKKEMVKVEQVGEDVSFCILVRYKKARKEVVPDCDGSIESVYRPLSEKPTLFTEFLNLKPTVEEIRSFIENYGTLRGGRLWLVERDFYSPSVSFYSMFCNGKPWEGPDFRTGYDLLEILEVLPREQLERIIEASSGSANTPLQGRETLLSSRSREKRKSGAFRVFHSESMVFWVQEIWRMASAFQIWRIAEERDYELLKQTLWYGPCHQPGPSGVLGINCVVTNLPREILIKIFSSAEEVYEAISQGNQHVISSLRSHLPEGVPLLMAYACMATEKPNSADDEIRYLKYLLQEIINVNLRDKVNPFLRVKADGTFEPYLAPGDLLSAMWLQFYFSVLGERKIKRCPVCGLWEDVTERSERWTMHPECSTRERSRRYYSKVKQARKMFKEGKSVEEIASALDKSRSG